MYKIAKENLSALFQKIAETNELYLPIKTAGQVNFGVYTDGAEVDIDTLKSVKSPKDVFFPQSENLYTCSKDGKKIKIEPQALQEQDFVVFGMKGCDIKGIEVLDKVFLADPIDTFYAARRNHGIIVAMACNEPVRFIPVPPALRDTKTASPSPLLNRSHISTRSFAE